MLPKELQSALANLPLAEIRYFDTIGSTNAEALALAEKGAPDGCLVIADHQFQGRGRMGRNWVTNPGAGLAFSLVLRARTRELSHLALFSPLAALSVSRVLEDDLSLTPLIKWPNDVLVSGKKICGILAEAIWHSPETATVVLGIGINITPASVPPPDQVIFPAACLEAAAGRPVDRWHVLAGCIQNILAYRAILDSPAFIDEWTARLAFRGERISLENAGSETVEGIFLGVTPEGNLRLKLDQGQEVQFSAGDVHLRPARSHS